MNAYRYKNFINKDPILDFLKTQTKYKMDNELKGFDKDLLLENYTKQNKQIFCKLVFEKLGDDVIKVAHDAFVMKTRNIRKHFKNYSQYKGTNYSLFTIEYSTITVLKNGSSSQTHKYYNFKNWLNQKECGYTLDNSFLIGRRYSGYSSFDMLVSVPYTFESLLIEADEHFRDIKNKKIGVDIFPNMKNTCDYPYHNAKKRISDEYNELSAVKGISIKERDLLVSMGITSRTHIDLERSDKNFVNFKKLPLDIYDNTKLFFVDFEILTNVYDDFTTFPKSNTKNHLFNIGFCCPDISEPVSFVSRKYSEEKEMMENFVNFVNNLEETSVTFIHWTNIEKRILEEKMKEYVHLQFTKEIVWLDLHNYFVKSDIYIKGCLNYKLKNVSRSLEQMGMITSTWDNGLFFDGLGAMTGFIKYLKTLDEEILNEIVKYNIVDCKVMMEIYNVIIEDLKIPDS